MNGRWILEGLGVLLVQGSAYIRGLFSGVWRCSDFKLSFTAPSINPSRSFFCHSLTHLANLLLECLSQSTCWYVCSTQPLNTVVVHSQNFGMAGQSLTRLHFDVPWELLRGLTLLVLLPYNTQAPR